MLTKNDIAIEFLQYVKSNPYPTTVKSALNITKLPYMVCEVQFEGCDETKTRVISAVQPYTQNAPNSKSKMAIPMTLFWLKPLDSSNCFRLSGVYI